MFISILNYEGELVIGRGFAFQIWKTYNWGGGGWLYSEVYCIYSYFTSVCSGAPSLGVASGGRLPDSSFAASSVYNPDYAAKSGRLNHSPYAWCQKSASTAPTNYLQVDLGAVFWVCGVATQGDNGGSRTTRYKLAVSTDGASWYTYQQDGRDKVSLFHIQIPCRLVVRQLMCRPVKIKLEDLETGPV